MWTERPRLGATPNSPHGARNGLCFQRPRGIERSAQKATALVIGSDRPRPRSFLSFPGGWDGQEHGCSARDLGSIPGWGICPGEGHGNPSSTLTGRIPWIEELGRLLSMESVRHDWGTNTHIDTQGVFQAYLVKLKRKTQKDQIISRWLKCITEQSSKTLKKKQIPATQHYKQYNIWHPTKLP